MTHPQKWTGKGVRSYDDKQNEAKLVQCDSCALWFWATQQPPPGQCMACRLAALRAE